MRKRRSKANKKQKSIITMSVILVVIIAFVVALNGSKTSFLSISNLASKILGAPLTTGVAIESVSMEENGYSANNGVPGTWHLTESAHWTAIDKAEAKIEIGSLTKKTEIDFKSDIILVLDNSVSMTGIKLDRAKRDSKEIIETILEDESNRIALITYNDQATVLSDFTNNKNSLLSMIDSIPPVGSTNYNDPLKNVDSIMENYVKQDGRKITTVFLTDGQPNVDVPNQIATYQLLKRKYPYMTINGIQYEMGDTIKQDLIDVTDNQWVANVNTLNNVLYEVTGLTETIVGYEKFEVENEINTDLFTVNSVDDIDVTAGTVQLIEENGEQKIIWTLDNRRTGFGADMRINLTLKDEYKYQTGYYPTSLSTQVSNNLEGENVKVKRTTDTPVLEKKTYSVIYDANSPEGETVTNIPSNETHYQFDTVTKAQNEPKCEGWVFKGWEMITDGVEYINDDVFIMPAKDVTIRAVWTKLQIAIKMDGAVASTIDIHVGDTVLYNPSGTYVWDASLASDYEVGSDEYNYIQATLDSSDSYYNVSTWKVLNVDAQRGVVEVVPPTSSMARRVTLHGAQGYNNSVYLLNNACDALYSDSSKGIKARNIDENDLIKIGKREYATDTDTENAMSRFIDQYINSYSAGTSHEYANKPYPAIFGEQKDSVINGVGVSNGLLRHQQNRPITRNEDYIKQASTYVVPQTGFTFGSYNKFKTYCDSEKVAILTPNTGNTCFWIATRDQWITHSSYDRVYFGVLNFMYGGIPTQSGLYNINVYSNQLVSENETANSLYPVVTISNRHLEPTENAGEFRVK